MKSSAVGQDRIRSGYAWAKRGDINAFFGLMLDNIGGMILMASLLVGVFHLPRLFVLTRMIPGTAVGVLVGDLIYTYMAFRLAQKSGRSDVTAMPLGLDTPSTFGTVFLIVGPAYQASLNRGLDPESTARHAWFVGIAM
jgi:AGZA family xanthine/uracil permease-like MFS transporter